METTPSSNDSGQETKKKRSPWLIIILILLLLIVGCCILGAVLCRGSQRLPRFLDRLIDYAEDAGVDADEFWRLIEEGDLDLDGDGDGPGPGDGTQKPELIEEDDVLTPDGPQGVGGCPVGPTEFVLEIDHNWDFSPNREIEKMKIEAEQNAESDKKLKEDADTLNSADSLIFQVNKSMGDLGDKITEEQKNEITTTIDKLREAHNQKNVSEVKVLIEEVNSKFQKITQDLYSQTQETDEGGFDASDVEFEEVK